MKVYIYGAHVKVGYFKEYSTFSDLYEEGMPRKKKGIEFLVRSKSNFKKYKGDIIDDIGFKRNLNSYAEYRSGKANTKLKLQMQIIQEILAKQYGKEVKIVCNHGNLFERNEHDRLVLMNDEVMWQWNTGSPLYYRFETIDEAKKFYIHCLDGETEYPVEIENLDPIFKYQIGSYVKFLNDFYVEPSVENLNFDGYTYHKGDIVRIYDINDDYFYASGQDNKTFIRIPNSGGGKKWISYGKIPLNIIEKSNFQEFENMI